MPKTIISEGKTTNEAIENGLKELNVTKNDVEIKILENTEKRSFFSILAPRVVKVEMTVKEKNISNKDKENKEKIIYKREHRLLTMLLAIVRRRRFFYLRGRISYHENLIIVYLS